MSDDFDAERYIAKQKAKREQLAAELRQKERKANEKLKAVLAEMQKPAVWTEAGLRVTSQESPLRVSVADREGREVALVEISGEDLQVRWAHAANAAPAFYGKVSDVCRALIDHALGIRRGG